MVWFTNPPATPVLFAWIRRTNTPDRITYNGTFERTTQIETVTTLHCARSSATGTRAQDVAAEDECALPLYSNYYRIPCS